MKFVVRKAVVLGVLFHIFAYLYVIEILRAKNTDPKEVEVEEREATSSSGEDGKDYDTYDNTTYVEENEVVLSLEDRIKGLESILQPAVNSIILHRMQARKQQVNVKWNMLKTGGSRLHANDYNLLHILAEEYPQVKTLPTVAILEDLAKYLLPYYYDFSSNMCSAPMFQQKGPQNPLQWVYNATCRTYIADTLKPVPFKQRSRALRIWNYAGYLKDPSKVLITYLHMVPNAVADKYGDVTTNNISLVPERCEANKYWNPSTKIDSLDLFNEVFTVHQMYGRDLSHNALENLPRLAPYVNFLRNNPQIKVHAGYSNSYLELLTISPKRVVSEGVRATTTYMPAGTLCETASLFNAQLLSFYLRQGLHNNQKDRNVVVILRDTTIASQAYTKLYSHVYGMAKQETAQNGLILVPFGDVIERSLATTRELFNRAIIVLAPRSTATIVHMYFSQPGTVLIEGLCQETMNSLPKLTYASFAQALGLRYHAVLSDAGCDGQTGVNEFKMALKFYLSKQSIFGENQV